jgi:hypothetical protein
LLGVDARGFASSITAFVFQCVKPRENKDPARGSDTEAKKMPRLVHAFSVRRRRLVLALTGFAREILKRIKYPARDRISILGT